MNGILLLLPVFLPLVLGLLSYFLPIRSESCRRLVYSLLILGTTALAWAAILLCDDGTFTLLHFSHRLTIAFRMDGAARLFAGLSATLWPFTMLYGFDYMRHEKHLHMFWAFFTASFGVTLGIAFSANMMTMYLFYELLTLATLPLVMQPMTKAAKKAGVKYLVYSISGAALAFIGLVFLAIHDASDFSLGGHLAGYDGDLSMLLAVFALSFVGFGVKAAIWPLHGWLPSAAVAPTPVTALLHAVAVVKAGAFACIRLIYYSFGPDILSGTWAQQLALLLPILYCVLDAAGTFADSLVLETLDEGSANVAYELTFLIAGLLAGGYVLFVKREKLTVRSEGPKYLGAVCETIGQFFYIYALADKAHVAMSAPIIASYCAVSVLWSRLFLKEKLSWKHYAAIAITVAGIAIIGLLDP